MAVQKLSARPSRLEVLTADQSSSVQLAFDYVQIDQDAYQYNRYPQINLATVIRGVNVSGAIDYTQSINPVLNPLYFSFGNMVRYSIQKTNGTWVQLFIGVIVKMRYSDGRGALNSGKEAPSLSLKVTDFLGSTATIDYPQDLSDVTLGTSKPAKDVVNSMLGSLGLGSISGTEPTNPYSTQAPISYNPNNSRSVVDLGHKILWCNPPERLKPQYLYNDSVGNYRIQELNLEPTNFLINGNADDDLAEYINTDQEAEIPPKTVTITGQVDDVEQSEQVTSTSTSRGDLRVPSKPRVITEASGNTPAVLENSIVWQNVPLSRTTVTSEIRPLGNPSFSPEVLTTTTVEEAGALVYTKSAIDIQEELSTLTAIDSIYRTSTALITSRETVNRKIFGGPSDRLSQEISTTTGLAVKADENDTSSNEITLEQTTITYDHNPLGIVTQKTTVKDQARGLADSASTKDEDRTETVTSEVIVEKWEPMNFTGNTDRYTYTRNITRPFGENQSITETLNPESQPPQTDFFPDIYEVIPREVTCSFNFIYGTNGVARDRTFDYSNALLTGEACQRSAEIEARLIHGQTPARNIKFSLTDDVIDKIWPAGTDYLPYIRVVDPEDGNTYTYLVDNLRIRDEYETCYAECFGIFLNVETTAVPAIKDSLVAPEPRVRIRAGNNIRITTSGGVRVPT